MDKTFISYYSGYRHNRYEGYNASWGVLAALGASHTADCFADEDDYPDDEFDALHNDAWFYETKSFRKNVLLNLDCDKSTIEMIQALDVGETYEHKEFVGDTIRIIFERVGDQLIVDFDGKEKFICEF